jgi:hypothetical protein
MAPESQPKSAPPLQEDAEQNALLQAAKAFEAQASWIGDDKEADGGRAIDRRDTYLTCAKWLRDRETELSQRALASPQEAGEGHRVEIEFDGYGPGVKLIHPEGGCPLPKGVCEDCGADLQDPESKRCTSCNEMVPGWCWVQDWVENEGYELLHGKVTLPVEPEWDGDSCRLHLHPAASAQPTSAPPVEEGDSTEIVVIRAGGKYETFVPKEHEVTLTAECPWCAKANPNVLTVDEASAVVAASFAEDHDARVLEATIKRLGDWVDEQVGAAPAPLKAGEGEG